MTKIAGSKIYTDLEKSILVTAMIRKKTQSITCCWDKIGQDNQESTKNHQSLQWIRGCWKNVLSIHSQASFATQWAERLPWNKGPVHTGENNLFCLRLPRHRLKNICVHTAPLKTTENDVVHNPGGGSWHSPKTHKKTQSMRRKLSLCIQTDSRGETKHNKKKTTMACTGRPRQRSIIFCPSNPNRLNICYPTSTSMLSAAIVCCCCEMLRGS